MPERILYSVSTLLQEKNKTKQNQKDSLKEELKIMRCWFSYSEIFPVISVCPDEKSFSGHRRSAVDPRQKYNCSKKRENFKFQIAAAFCILQVPYGKNMHKTVLWHLHILQNFLLYLPAFIFVCLWVFKLYDNCSLTVKVRFSCLVWASTCYHRPVSDFCQVLTQRDVFYNPSGVFGMPPSSPACMAAPVLPALDLHSCECP